MSSVNSGSRLDRLPIGPFHRRIMLLIGIGLYVSFRRRGWL